MRAAWLLPLAAALLVGCTPAAAQTAQRAYLPLAQLREPPGTPTASRTATPVPGRACPADRLAVRALSDPDAGLVGTQPVARTTRELRETAPPPALGPDTPRQDRLERATFQLRVAVVELSLRASGALALTVADPDDPALTGLVELPDPDCTAVAASPRAAEIAAARDALLRACGVSPGPSPTRLYGGATIAGVGFFDPRPAAGAPPNGLVLSPVLSFASGDCNPFAPPSPTATPRRLGTAVPSTATPTGTPSPTVAATITFAGADSRRSPTYHLAAGRWRFEIAYGGSATVDAYVLKGGTNQGYFAQCPTACSTGATMTLTDGDYNVQVVTAGGWTVTIRPG